MLFAVYDTETTGLTLHPQADLKQQPRIIEFGGLITDGKEIISELEFICNPGIAIEKVITDITGLTNEELADKPPFSEFIEPLAAFFSRAHASIAHNASFDKSLLAFDLLRCGQTLNNINFPYVTVCTVEQTFHQFGRRMKLVELYEMYCGPYVQKHRALDDVKLLHEVCQKIGLYEAFEQGKA